MEKFTNEGYGLIGDILDLKASPDGRFAAYTVRTMNIEADAYETRIWAVDLARQREFRLTAGPRDRCVAWLPDGRLLFAGNRGGQPDRETALYAISPEGGEAERFMAVPVPGATVLPAGEKRWLVLSEEDRNAEEEKAAPNWMFYREYPLHVEGQGYASRQRMTIQLWDEDAQALKPLLDPMLHVMMPFFSAPVLVGETGFWFAGTRFDRDRDGQESVYYYDWERGEATELFGGPYYMYSLARHDGRIIAGAWVYSGERVGTMRILSADENGGDSRVDLEPGWQMLASEGGLFVMADCAVERLCRREGRVWSVVDTGDVRVGSVAALSDGCLLTGWEPGRLPEVWRLDADGVMTRLSHRNDALFERYAFSQPVNLKVGDIEGWVIPPTEMKPGERCPAIVTVHGGPHGYYGTRFQPEFQRWASEGCFVVYCNPHGSVSYGVEFANINGQMGVTDFQEIMAFLDGALARWPQMDGERLAITGQSYGGYMTNWAIGHTHRFKAAVARMSISNWISMRGTSDEKWYLDSLIGATPWDDLAKVWFHSPLASAREVTTPTLFIQHEKDNSTPPEQAEQMFTALLERGVPTKLMVNLGCGHGGRKVSQLLHDIDVMLAWFAEYLI